MWKWLATLFSPSTNRILTCSRFDKHKSSILFVPPGDHLAGLFLETGSKLKQHNVFILNELSQAKQGLEEVLKKIGKHNFLAVAVYGKTGSVAFRLIQELEKRQYRTALVLIDAALDPEMTFSNDRELVSSEAHFEMYLSSIGTSNSWLKSNQEAEIQKLAQQQTRLEMLNPGSTIKSDIYFLQAIGGFGHLEQDLSSYTEGEIYPFPIPGHHYELLKDYLSEDLSFFISNILKGRQNLAVFTLTTQAATPNWLLDQENRPMGEGKAPAVCKEAVPFEMKQCPYTGSRKKHEKPMNVSALKQMRASWEESLNLIRCIRDLYFRQHPKNGKAPDLLDLWKITLFASYLPTWMIYRSEKRVLNREIPSRVAAVYKMFIGLKAPVEKMIRDQLTAVANFENLSSKTVHDYAESSKAFIGPEEVCGGPENLITEFLEAILDISKPGKPDELDLDIIGREADYLSFIHAIINLKIFQKVRFQQTQFLVKSYLKHCTDQKQAETLKKAFYLSDDSLSADLHLSIVATLSEGLEQAERFSIRNFSGEHFSKAQKVLEADREINKAFFDQIRIIEEQLLDACGYSHNVKVNASIFAQYMGEMSLSGLVSGNE